MNTKPQAQAHEELKKMRMPILNVNVLHRENLSLLEGFAEWITSHIGTMGFFLLVLLWTLVWLVWNMIVRKEFQFDPYPGFVLWLFLSNVLQLFLMPLIMVGQNLQGRHSEARAESDYHINLRTEREVEAVLLHLEHQNEMLLKIINAIEKKATE